MANYIPKGAIRMAAVPINQSVPPYESSPSQSLQHNLTQIDVNQLAEQGKKDKQAIEILYTLYKNNKNPQALKALEKLAEKQTTALHFLYRIAKEDFIFKKINDPQWPNVKIYLQTAEGPTSQHLKLLLKDPKFNRTKIKYNFQYAELSLQSSFSIGVGGNRDRKVGFRSSIFPIEAKWIFNANQPSYKWQSFFLTVAPEARFGTGPVGWVAGGARIGGGYGWIGANFRTGIHLSGHAYVGGEIDVPGLLFRPNLFDSPETVIFYFLPNFIMGYERVLGADRVTRRVEESIYFGVQWVIPWWQK